MTKPAWLRPPQHLRGQALAFWNAHATMLWRREFLTRDSVPSFVQLCRLMALVDAAWVSRNRSVSTS